MLLRARRLFIAGDEKQMPPTRFFDAQLVDEPEEMSNATDEAETTRSRSSRWRGRECRTRASAGTTSAAKSS